MMTDRFTVAVVDRAIARGIRGIFHGARRAFQDEPAVGYVGPGGVAMPQAKPHAPLDMRGRWPVWDRYDPFADVAAAKCLAKNLTEDRAMAIAYGLVRP